MYSSLNSGTVCTHAVLSPSVSTSLQNLNIGPRYEAQKKVLEERSEYPSIVIEKKLLAKKKNTVSKTYKEEDKKSRSPGFFGLNLPKISEISTLFNKDLNSNIKENFQRNQKRKKETYVPLHRTEKKEIPMVYSSYEEAGKSQSDQNIKQTEFPQGPRVLDLEKEEFQYRQKRSTEEMGVKSGYKVISEVDLAFKPSFEKGIGVTVFQGKMIPEEVVYGVCIPATGFSALFVLISLFTVLSVLVAGFVCYHRQLQKHIEEGAPTSSWQQKIYQSKPCI